MGRVHAGRLAVLPRHSCIFPGRNDDGGLGCCFRKSQELSPNPVLAASPIRTGSNPPHPALTAKEYTKAGIPWFDYYRDDLRAVEGSKTLAGVKSIAQLSKAKGTGPLPENATVEPELIVQFGNTRRPDDVRDWTEP